MERKKVSAKETIDTCYEGIVHKLTAQDEIQNISTELIACTTNNERVLFVRDIMKRLNAFPKVTKSGKSSDSANHYKNLGNDAFQKSNYFKALQYYNLAVSHAPQDMEIYPTAISNRSAVSFHLKKYKECLQDIEKVFSIKFPEKLRDKLIRRQEKCRSLINEDDTCKSLIDQMTTMGPKHNTYLCASSKIEVACTEDMGRHVKAVEDISVGEVLACEKPYFSLLLKSQLLYTCSHCMLRTTHLIPCPSCTFALYCSDKCQETAWKAYHIVECPLMVTFDLLEFTKLELLALRVVIKARTDHATWNELFNTIKLAEGNIDTEYHGQVQDGDRWVYDSKYYAPIHSLATNVSKRSISDIFQKSVTAAVLFELLKSQTNFMEPTDGEKLEEIEICVAELLLRHGMTSPTNMHNISANIENAAGECVEEVSLGSAPYAFLSLINHSCAPNVVRYNKLNTATTYLIALRPIMKGMQLFDNYGSHHALEPCAERQQQLMFQYRFRCACEACVGNWPTYFCLNDGSAPRSLIHKKQNVLTDHVMKKLQKADCQSIAAQVFKPLCDLAASFEPFAPCVHLADCQEALKQCLAIFGGTIPRGYSAVVDWPAIPKIV